MAQRIGKSTARRIPDVRQQRRDLMLSDLLPTTSATGFRWIARHVAIAISAIFALGMAGIGTGRTIESSIPKTDKIQQQPQAGLASAKIAPVVLASAELMHEAAPTISIPTFKQA